MAGDEFRLKHFDYIQATIARLAANSFAIKGWSITVAAAVLALGSARVSPSQLAVIASVSTGAFWGLDAYYLRNERLYRRLYDVVRLDDQVESLTMSTLAVRGDVPSWPRTLIAAPLIALYPMIIFALILGASFL